MVAHALAFSEFVNTGRRPVSAGARQALNCVAAGGRLVQTRSGYALFDEDGRYVGQIRTPAAATKFGPAGPTMLLERRMRRP